MDQDTYSMSTPRRYHGLELIDGKLFAIGGFDGDGTTANVEAYDIQSQKWTRYVQTTK